MTTECSYSLSLFLSATLLCVHSNLFVRHNRAIKNVHHILFTFCLFQAIYRKCVHRKSEKQSNIHNMSFTAGWTDELSLILLVVFLFFLFWPNPPMSIVFSMQMVKRGQRTWLRMIKRTNPFWKRFIISISMFILNLNRVWCNPKRYFKDKLWSIYNGCWSKNHFSLLLKFIWFVIRWFCWKF